MTSSDQTKAPELPPKVVIWERADFESGDHSPRGWTSSFAASLHPHHYVRADLAAEQVREAYERGLEDAARVAVARLVNALESGKSFAESWIEENGGIDGCDYQDRVSYENICAVLAACKGVRDE